MSNENRYAISEKNLTQTNSDEIQHNRIPVFIGVTGHRGIRKQGDDETKLRNAVRNTLEDISNGWYASRKNAKRYGKTKFVILTALAAGSDQLVAEVARDMEMDFAVVLPMEKNRYLDRIGPDGEPDFKEEDKRNFNSLIKDKHCLFVYQLPDDYIEEEIYRELSQTEAEAAKNPELPGYAQAVQKIKTMRLNKERTLFRNCARFISDNSALGLALWDGLYDEKKVCGPGRAVCDSLHGESYRSELSRGVKLREIRPIFHIYTPRAERTNVRHEADKVQQTPKHDYDFKTRVLMPEPMLETGENWFNLNIETANGDEQAISDKFSDSKNTQWKQVGKPRAQQLDKIISFINGYNIDVVNKKKFIEEHHGSLNGEIKKNGEVIRQGLTNIGKSEAICEHNYGNADGLALLNEKRRNRYGILVILLAGISYICLNAFSDLIDVIPFLAFYLGLLIVAFIVLQFVKIKLNHEKYVSYRAIAEGMRVQYYWYAADIKGDNGLPALVQDYYLRSQNSHIEWVRYAIRAINLFALAENQKENTQSVRCESVYKVSDIWLGKMDQKVFRKDHFGQEKAEWEYPIIKKFGDNGQSGYFLKKSLKYPRDVVNSNRDLRKTIKRSDKHVKATTLNALYYSLITLSMVGVVFILLCYVYKDCMNDFFNTNLFCGITPNNVTMFTVGALPIVAMILREIGNFMGYQKDVERYSWYHKAFKRAIIDIDECKKDIRKIQKEYGINDSAPIESIPVEAQNKLSDVEDSVRYKLFDIGKEALIENADWVLLNEDRIPEVPSN